MGLCLYVGMDDSNHAGEGLRGEINLATFSLIHQDSIVKNFKNVRDEAVAKRWMQNPERDYRFTVLTGEGWEGSENLVRTAPLLIHRYLEENKIELDALKLYLDGNLTSSGKGSLRRQFLDIPTFVVDNFIKKSKNSFGRTEKHPRCPEVVYMADVWANIMFRKTVEECFRDPKYVPFVR